MKVSELIEQLLVCDLDAEVDIVYSHYNGHEEVQEFTEPVIHTHRFGVTLTPDVLFFEGVVKKSVDVGWRFVSTAKS